MQHIAVTKDLHPLAKKLNIKYRALGKYQMAVKIAEGLITQGYVDVQSSDGKVNFIRLKRQNIVVKKQFECVDSIVNKSQSKPDDDIGGDTDSVATTDSSSNSDGDEVFSFQEKACFFFLRLKEVNVRQNLHFSQILMEIKFFY